MKRVLILGTNAGQADIIDYLKRENWEVHACAYKREGPGCDMAHYFHLVDTLNVEAVTLLAKNIDAQLVYSVSSDSAIKTVTKVSEILGLAHFINSEIIELFDKKELLRQFLNENNICQVAYTSFTSNSDINTWKHFPCVVKPSDSQGQRGVQLIENKEDFANAVALAIKESKSGKAIVEEYFYGIEMSSNVVVQNKKVIVNEFTERYVHGKHYFGLPKGHAIPVRNVEETTITAAKQMIEKMITALNMEDAILYVQMVATPQGVKIIEVAPRLDGCHIWRMIRFAKSYDLRAYAINLLLKNKIEHKVIDNGAFTLYFNQLPSGEKFERKNFKINNGKIVFEEYRYKDGEHIVPINGKLEVIGYYISKE